MKRRSSSEIGILIGLSIASSAMLIGSPILAAGGSQLVFGATDAMAARVGFSMEVGLAGPSAAVRIGARALAAALWGGAISAIATTHGSSAPRLLFLATALLFGVVVGAFGAAGARAAPAVEGPLIGACDAATAAWAFVLSLAAHDAPLRTRAMIAAFVAIALLLRAWIVARVILAAAPARATDEGRGTRIAALGFIAWLAAGSVVCAVAAHPITWSGLGAAVVLTVAALLVELRRRRARVLFLRSALAFAVATMLGVASFLSG